MNNRTNDEVQNSTRPLTHRFFVVISVFALFGLIQCTPPPELIQFDEYRKAALAEFNVSSQTQPQEGFPVFELRNDYPRILPEPEDWPWLHYDFQTQPEEYIWAVLNYALEGNVDRERSGDAIDVDWRLQSNPIRSWYHAPWMHRGNNPREPIHGLTRERGSRVHELGPSQTRRTRNWAIGFYNSTGAYTLGQVWKNPAYPDSESVRFAVGTVAIKLLFTDATDEEAPYLQGNAGLVWHVLINDQQPPIPMRLLQFDIAVRDERADSFTGWVFGTFVFDGRENGVNYWDNLAPVGLQWGNDPDLTHEKYQAGGRPLEGWINPRVAQMMQHRPPFGDLGYLGRVNGPVDNPFSACLACHGRAMDTRGQDAPPFTPNFSDMCIARQNMPQFRNETYVLLPDCIVTDEAESRIAEYFRNLRSSEPFWEQHVPLDYSLQLAVGIANWSEWKAVTFPQIDAMILNVQMDAATSAEFSTDMDSGPGLRQTDAFTRGD